MVIRHGERVLLLGRRFGVLKHTVNALSDETVRFVFLADNPGRWYFYCHNLYHMKTGMASTPVRAISRHQDRVADFRFM